MRCARGGIVAETDASNATGHSGDATMSPIGRWLMVIGGVLFVSGAIMQFAPWLLNWFGRLPGDIRIDGERGKVFIPLTSMIIVSVVVTLLVNLFRR